MAMSDVSESVILSNGSILSSASGPGIIAANDGDVAVQQLSSKETPRTKANPNGCLQLNGTIKPSFLPLDNQRTQQMLSQCCHPCPYHHSLSSHNNKQECHSVVGSSASSPMTSCCMQPHTEYSASICQKHPPIYQPACCLQPSPSFCLHHQWPDHFQHQPVQQHIARIRQNILTAQTRPVKFQLSVHIRI
uniref:Dispatched RND transporter family member 1 n=2 Tax=Anser TaxID=8842 RepID=A0A8B9CDA3_9AVES